MIVYTIKINLNCTIGINSPYLSLRCALGVPTICKGNEGERKGNIWFT